MTFDDIEQRIEHIRSVLNDDDQARSAMDSMLREFIMYVSTPEAKADSELSRKALCVLLVENLPIGRQQP